MEVDWISDQGSLETVGGLRGRSAFLSVAIDGKLKLDGSEVLGSLTTMTLHGHIHNGEIIFDAQVTLPEGASVRVEVLEPQASASAPATEGTPTLLEALGDVVGALDDLPTDGARNLDHYLYGAPKR